MRRLIGLVGIALAAGWLVLTAGPIQAQSSQNVTATVQVRAAACITISSTSISYPASGLSSGGTPTLVTPSSTAPVVTGCSTGTQDFLARGANATGTGASWQLISAVDCSGPADRYRHHLIPTSGTALSLSNGDQNWETGVPASGTRNLVSRLTMPCTGSTGVGATMSMPIFITAVVQ